MAIATGVLPLPPAVRLPTQDHFCVGLEWRGTLRAFQATLAP